MYGMELEFAYLIKDDKEIHRSNLVKVKDKKRIFLR